MVPKGVAVLTYAVRPRVVLKYYGQLSVSLVGMTAVPLLAGFWLDDLTLAWRCTAAVILLLLLGLPLARLKAPGNIETNEGLTVTALTFVTAAGIMGWALGTPDRSYLDSVFEATSAITTTGLSTLGPAESLPAAHLLSRAWLQWYGGLVIVVLSLALVLRPGAAARRLAGSDAEAHDMVAGTRIRARRVLVVYGGLTVVGLALLLALGIPVFPALIHTLAGVSTGGFSSYEGSLAGLGGWTLQAAVILLALLGAVSFSLYYRSWQGGWRTLVQDREVLGMIGAGLATALVVALTMSYARGGGLTATLGDSLLIAFSAQTTAGFTPLPVDELDAGSKLALIAAMVVGGDAGSTAGGIKILRFLIVARLVQLLVVRACLPAHAHTPVRVAGRQLEPEEILTAVSIVLLFAVTIVVSWLPFIVLGHDPVDALFDVVSALGTVGLTTGVTAPDLHPVLKAVLCVDMFMGRLEIVAILILFYPRNWFGRRASSA